MLRSSTALKKAINFFTLDIFGRRRVLAGSMIALIATPTMFLPPRSSAQNFGRTVSAPLSAPPEPFVIHQEQTFTGMAVGLVAPVSAAINSLAPRRPEGLAAARIPTFGERFLSSIVPLIALIKPSTSTMTSAPPPQPSSVVDFDFDNDGKADIGRWHSANTEFKVKNSNGGSFSTFTIGSSSSKLAPGDYNGDGKTDAAVFSSGTWTYKTSTSATAQTISWGAAGDVPVAGDYDGDGTTDAAVYRPSNSSWWVAKSGGGSISTTFGTTGDIAVPGDYDGDGSNDLAVFRASTGTWYVTGTTRGYFTCGWGISSDTPVPADYDGDGKTDPAVFRSSTGTWYIYRSQPNDGSYYTQTWGNYADQPVPGDYDGDGKADYAIWRPTTGVWYTLKSSDSSYSIDTLGVPGDIAIPSAYLKQVGGEVTGDALAAARLQPRNATGGTDLYSQNFSWGTSLVSLPGRAGLDASFGISYNSLVWTKVGNAMVFDADHSNASPGFKLGFPTIEPIYYDEDKDVWSYMMVTPSGGRIEFRQTPVTNVYETADSSYTQLAVNGATNPNDPVEVLTLKVTTTDGTQMSYAWSQGAYRCTQIKDRNGSFISIAHDGEGRLNTVTDTLGRVITVNYDGTTGLPGTITQTWKGSNGAGSNLTHTWATFSYTSTDGVTGHAPLVNTDFGSLTVVGPPNGTALNVLQKITYSDGSFTKFSYNNYVQVVQVENFAADNHKLNHTRLYDIESVSGTQSDTPRFTVTKSWTENFNSGNDLTINNTAPASASYSFPGSISGSAKVIDVWMTGHPDNLRTKTYVGASGWNEGLTIGTEDCLTTSSTCSDRKRWTWNEWTQDNTSASYITNPRIKESRVGDTTNVKVTKTDYRIVSGTTNTAEYGLVSEARVYDANDLTNPIKKVATDYNLGSAYTSRRIIGLPSQAEVWGKNDVTSSLEYVSKMTYGYDDEDFSYESNQIVTPSQHDTSYGSSFVVGRGNLTSTTRHDVTSSTAASVSKVRYDIAGSPVAQLDPRNRKTTISYSDFFNTTVSPATFAFPTTITDASGNSSAVQYRFDIGANVWAQSPTPYGASTGKTTSRTYDDTLGRLVKDKIENTGAYTRYDYPNNDGVTIRTFSTVVDITGVGTVDSSDEVLTETLLDGAGRVRRTRTENPNSTGGYTGKLVEYDILGRVKRETVPTEIDSSWNPDGDDDRGSGVWLWNSREYDWKGRVTREINADGTDKLYSYEGCGCAGGQVTTIKGEITEAVDASDVLQTTKRRTQKILEDILGRVKTTEIWDLDGGDGVTPYSSTVNRYNGRDQVIVAEQHAGAASSSNHQDTTFEFDGHGRLKKSHKPEQFDSSNVSTFTTYTYNADDTVATMTDPRGAVTAYKYGQLDSDGTEDRALLTKIQYTSPNTTNIPEPDDVSFSYDPPGNRTSMSDGTGNLAYAYDELSRLTSETKTFSDTLSQQPSGGYVLSYTYHLSGGLKSINAPFSHEILYTVDKIGRSTAIGDGTSTTRYASGITRRAFGALEAMTLSSTDPISVSLTYDNRLRVASYSANSTANSTPIHEADYTYHNDNKLHVSDSESGAPFGQTNKYDFAGRLKGNDAGTPYRQVLTYDAFNNLTHRQTWTYSLDSVSFNATYSKNRKTTGGATSMYDVAGNVTSSVQSSPVDNFQWNFDVAGRQSRWQEFGPYGANQFRGERLTFDGDNRPAKRSGLAMTRIGGVWGDWVETNSYGLYSSVTGKKITELLADGGHYRTHVYYGDTNFADERNGDVYFIATDPISGSTREALESGELPPSDESESRNELGGLGTSIPVTAPSSMPEPNYSKGGSAGGAEGGCRIDGIDQDGPGPCMKVLKAGVGDVVDTDPFTASDFGIYRTPRYGYREHKGGGALAMEDPDEDTTPVTVATEEDRFLIGWDDHFFGSNQERFDIAVQRVRDVLGGNNDCARFFQKTDVALAALNAFANKATISVVDSMANDATGIRQTYNKKNPMVAFNADGTKYVGGKPPAAYRVFGMVTVNLNGPFFDKFNTKHKPGNYAAGEMRSQVLQILHELAHAVLDSKGKPLIVDDGGDQNLSEKNSEIIKTACLKEIEASGKR